MRGNKFIKITSLVFAIWYLMCIVGFDVHTCGHSGRSFVSSLMLQATANAGEDVLCHQSGCCKGEDCVCKDQDGITSRCSDDYFTLSAPAVSRYDDDHSYLQPACFCGNCPSPAESVMLYSIYSSDDSVPDFQDESFFLWPDFKDIQSVLSVWRI